MGWSVKKIPTVATLQATSVLGIERRATRQAFPLWEFEATFEALREQTQNDPVYLPTSPYTELEQISGLFLACRGDYGEFYFNDPDDNSRLSVPLGISDGVGLSFLTYATYPSGNHTSFEPVGGLQSVEAVYLNGSLYMGGHLGPFPNGQFLTWPTAPPVLGTEIAASYHFYYRCRFIDDMQNYSQFYKNLWEYKSCKFRSVKP